MVVEWNLVEFKWDYPLVMTNRSPRKPWPIEIDGITLWL